MSSVPPVIPSSGIPPVIPAAPAAPGFGSATAEAVDSLGEGLKAVGQRVAGTGVYAGKGIANAAVSGAHVAEKGVMGPLKMVGKAMQRFPGASALVLAGTAVAAAVGWHSKHKRDEHIHELEAQVDMPSLPAAGFDNEAAPSTNFAQREMERRQGKSQVGPQQAK